MTVDRLDLARALANSLRAGGDSSSAALIDELCCEVEGSRRQTAQLGFDLHDEGLQDLAALRHDLHFFREQLSLALETPADRSKIVSRVDDFLARVVSLDIVLREVAGSTRAPAMRERPLSSTLESIVDASSGACLVELTLDSGLNVYGLSDAQQTAIIRVVQSALANIVQHSNAETARVAVRCLSDEIEIEIVDDGDGFDVEQSLRRAAKQRRLGLVGIHERMLMLGGTVSLTSRIGGPTRLLCRLPRQNHVAVVSAASPSSIP